MRYVIRVIQTRSRDIVVDSNDALPEVQRRLQSNIIKSENKFFNDGKPITKSIYSYTDMTDTVKQALSERQFNNLIPNFVFLEEENTVRARQYAQSICELFEDILEKHDITIPDPDLNSKGEDEEAARIYGETYFNLEDDITNMITEMVNRIKREDIEVISDTY